jgi:hypothetical protein
VIGLGGLTGSQTLFALQWPAPEPLSFLERITSNFLTHISSRAKQMRSRCLLHFNQIEAFIEFCKSEGWHIVPTKGEYECLRMVNGDRKHPLIVHSRNSAKAHFTTWGESEWMTKKFLANKKGGM